MNELVREKFKEIDVYQVSDNQYDVVLNANENYANLFKQLPKEKLTAIIDSLQLNRYPESNNMLLRKTFASMIGRETEETIAGVGSDEILRMIVDVFLENEDVVVACVPTFSMYQYFTELAKGTFLPVAPNKETLEPNIDELIATANRNKAKIIFICTPNNPTGYLWSRNDIDRVVRETTGMVVIDEAYIDFADENNLDMIDISNRIIVLRTLSKAFAMAGVRIGFAIANKETIQYLQMAKVPYNISTVSQELAVLMLQNHDIVMEQVSEIKKERARLLNTLEDYAEQIKVYPTGANFIFISTSYYDAIKNAMEENSISLRYFGDSLPNAIRISVGSREENDKLIKVISEVLS